MNERMNEWTNECNEWMKDRNTDIQRDWETDRYTQIYR